MPIDMRLVERRSHSRPKRVHATWARHLIAAGAQRVREGAAEAPDRLAGHGIGTLSGSGTPWSPLARWRRSVRRYA